MFSLEKMQLASYLLISCMASCLSEFQSIMIHDIKVRLPPNMKIFFTDFYKPHRFQVREAGWIAISGVAHTEVAEKPTWNLPKPVNTWALLCWLYASPLTLWNHCLTKAGHWSREEINKWCQISTNKYQAHQHYWLNNNNSSTYSSQGVRH